MAVQTYTATDLATRALRLLGKADPIDPIEAEDLDTVLAALNDWIDWLATQRLAIFYVGRHAHHLSASVASYTIGDGGTWNQARPSWIERVSVIPDRAAAYPNEIPLGRPLSVLEYQQIAVKSATAQYPTRAYYDRNWVAGLGTIYVYPVPTISVADLVLYTPDALTRFADATTAYSFPPGYARAIRYNLAIEIADEFNATPSARVERIARESLASIKRVNVQPNEASFDPGLLSSGSRRYNLYTDGNY